MLSRFLQMTTNIIYDKLAIGEALVRYLNFINGIKDVSLNPLKEPYNQKKAFDMARESDFLIVDAFIDGKPKGFQFVKVMEKKTLLLFYFKQVDIQDEGVFWLVLPYKLDRLSEKVNEILNQPPPSSEDFEKLEKSIIELSERKEHHD